MANQTNKLKVAVDIDGVLADQVEAVLKRIERDYGQKYSKDEINRMHWIFNGRDIWSEITKLLTDPEYVLAISVIDGSQEAIQYLNAQDNRDLCVVTARRAETEEATKLWLKMHFPCLKEYYIAKSGTKHTIPSNVLIDDYDLNIVEFVKSHPDRRGILFHHPWSLNDHEIENYADQVHYCNCWQSVLKALDEIADTI
jgi:5'(3')-deoxyribonucleotidase